MAQDWRGCFPLWSVSLDLAPVVSGASMGKYWVDIWASKSFSTAHWWYVTRNGTWNIQITRSRMSQKRRRYFGTCFVSRALWTARMFAVQHIIADILTDYGFHYRSPYVTQLDFPGFWLALSMGVRVRGAKNRVVYQWPVHQIEPVEGTSPSLSLALYSRRGIVEYR